MRFPEVPQEPDEFDPAAAQHGRIPKPYTCKPPSHLAKETVGVASASAPPDVDGQDGLATEAVGAAPAGGVMAAPESVAVHEGMRVCAQDQLWST